MSHERGRGAREHIRLVGLRRVTRVQNREPQRIVVAEKQGQLARGKEMRLLGLIDEGDQPFPSSVVEAAVADEMEHVPWAMT